MKKLILLCAIGLACISCSKESKAKKLIQTDLYNSLDDYKSYEPVQFSNVDSAFSFYLDEPIYIAYVDSMIYCSNECERLQALLSDPKTKNHYIFYLECIGKLRYMTDCTSSFLAKIEQYESSYKSYFTGWKMIHKYRCKINNESKLVVKTYYFNSSIDSIKKRVNGEDK